MEKTRREKIRRVLLRKQSGIFLGLIGVGMAMPLASGLADRHLITEGVAFIIVGFIGLLMSWTTMDIGDSIKDAIHSDGEQTRQAIHSDGEQTRQVIHSDGEQTRKILSEIVSTQKEMSATLKDIAKSQREFAGSQREIAESQRDIRELLARKI